MAKQITLTQTTVTAAYTNVVEDQGYEGASLYDLARELGVTPASLKAALIATPALGYKVESCYGDLSITVYPRWF